MKDVTDVLIQLAFELGQAYQRIYDSIGLDNVINFNDIALANSRGAQWNFKGDMSDLPELFKIHNFNKEKIKALNEIIDNLIQVKLMAKQFEIKE